MSGHKKIEKSDEQWREQLTPEQYYVCREKGTERPFSGEFCHHERDGTYTCVCCGAVLFESGTKFDAGCGWPSFWAAAAPGAINEHLDTSHGMVRTEITCAQCDAHLGHVFPDGPEPSGLRYCVNSLSLGFEEEQ